MAKNERFPLRIREQSVVVKIYREKAASNSTGYGYRVSWCGSDGVRRKSFACLREAKEEAERKAAHLAQGLIEAQNLSRSDVFELAEARDRVEPTGIPLISALDEWLKARELVGTDVLAACTEWKRRQTSTLKRITVAQAVEKFIAAKDAANKKGSRTYKSKLKPLEDYFEGRHIDSISVQEWEKYLGRIEDPVTRNDLRKRAVTLCRWAQRNNHIAEGTSLAVEKTERAKEPTRPIGILRPGEFARLLEFFRANHPEHLAALVIAGFCGVRADEIQGKRDARHRRQDWDDIDVDREFMSVTVAKENTPSSRMIKLRGAALAWLSVCPGPKKGPICVAGAMEKIRAIAIAADFKLPANCFRHSWITYRISLTQDKPATATEAGNSVAEIDRRYRVPRPESDGKEWFAIRPAGHRPPGERRRVKQPAEPRR